MDLKINCSNNLFVLQAKQCLYDIPYFKLYFLTKATIFKQPFTTTNDMLSQCLSSLQRLILIDKFEGKTPYYSKIGLGQKADFLGNGRSVPVLHGLVLAYIYEPITILFTCLLSHLLTGLPRLGQWANTQGPGDL